MTSALSEVLRSSRAALMPTVPRPLNYVDIVARGGVPRGWRILDRAGKIAAVFIEADTEEAMKLRKNGRVLCEALGSRDGVPVELKITRAPGLTSVLDPFVEQWPKELEPGREVVDRHQMITARLDSIWPSELGDPHFAKIDTQGYGLEVLKGFGDLLDRVLCLEIKVRLGPPHEGQP